MFFNHLNNCNHSEHVEGM